MDALAKGNDLCHVFFISKAARGIPLITLGWYELVRF